MLAQDPTGAMRAAVHRDVVAEEPHFAAGATLVLQQARRESGMCMRVWVENGMCTRVCVAIAVQRGTSGGCMP
jgi:hypothetical protein